MCRNCCRLPFLNKQFQVECLCDLNTAEKKRVMLRNFVKKKKSKNTIYIYVSYYYIIILKWNPFMSSINLMTCMWYDPLEKNKQPGNLFGPLPSTTKTFLIFFLKLQRVRIWRCRPHVHVIFYYYLLIYFLIYSLPFLYKLINIFSS